MAHASQVLKKINPQPPTFTTPFLWVFILGGYHKEAGKFIAGYP